MVREGTTNIIRDSDATACTIELHILDSPGAPRAVTLTMDNDRVHTLAAGSGGSGLVGRRAAGRPGRQHHDRASRGTATSGWRPACPRAAPQRCRLARASAALVSHAETPAP